MAVRPFFVTPPTSASWNLPKPRAETVSPAESSLSALVQARQFTWTWPAAIRSAAFPRDMRKPVEHTASSRRELTVSRTSSHRTAGMWRWAAGISVTASLARPALSQLESRNSATVSSTIRSALWEETRMSPTFSRTMPIPMRLPRMSRWVSAYSGRKEARRHRRGLSAISGSIQSGRKRRMFRSAPS